MDKCCTALIFTGGYCNTERFSPEDLRADLVIAADAGQITARRIGITPDILVGDFDSSPLPSSDFHGEIIQVPAEKDQTDTMLACDIAIERGAKHLRILGGTGGRIDHSLSNIFLLESLSQRGVCAVLCDGDNRLRFLYREKIDLPASGYRYFSLFALDTACVSISGCKYSLHDALLSRAHPYAVSNEITGDFASIAVSDGAVLLVESENEQ